MRSGLVVACILLATAIAFARIGYGKKKDVVLRVDVATSPLGLVARSYDTQFPGKTIHAFPGDTLAIVVQNDLGVSSSTEGSVNSLRSPNVTSLHVHGLHVSPKEDDVFSPVTKRKRYVYHIRKDHPSGTFWYHAHYHGSSLLQVGGGMAGALIVGEACGTIAVVQQTKTRTYKYASAASGSALPMGSIKANQSLLTVNGQIRPELQYSQRLRLINAAENDVLRLSFDCVARILARDGIELDPRLVGERLVVGPGSRADVELADECSRVMHDDEVLFTVVHSSPPKQKCPAKRHRESLIDATPRDSFQFEFDQGGRVRRDGVDYAWYGINGREYEDNATGPILHLGEVYEWILINPNTAQHPFHLHTNHFQIVDTTDKDNTDDYLVGDWRDTITLPTPGNVTIRFRPTHFVGTSLAHCHIFAHADLGMDLKYTIVESLPRVRGTRRIAAPARR